MYRATNASTDDARGDRRELPSARVAAWVPDRTRTTALRHWRSRREVGPGIYRVVQAES